MMDRHWDNQLDTMLDDLQNTVQIGGIGGNSVQSASNQHGDSRNGGISESKKEMSRTGGPGHQQTSSSSYQFSSEWRSSDGQPTTTTSLGTNDLSSIEKVKSVSKISSSSTQRVESSSYTSSAITQQNIKKNIHDLDHLLNDLSQGSSRDVSPSMPRRPTSRGSFNNPDLRSESRTSFQSSRSEERRERLMQNTLTRTPSLNRGQRRPTNLPSNSRPTTPLALDNNHMHDHSPHREHSSSSHHHQHSSHQQQAFSYNKHSSTSSTHNNEFRPVHTVPDPLTGRYADGRITPNHGYSKTFTSPKVDNANGSIPRRPDELLQNFGEEIDRNELEKINQEERIIESKLNNNNNKGDFIEPQINKPGPPVYYPTEEMYSTKHVIAHGEYSKVKGSSSKEESDHKKGAAVVPVCLPLCCAAPCVIM